MSVLQVIAAVRSSIALRVGLIVAASIVAAVLGPAFVAVSIASPAAWRDGQFIALVVVSVLIIVMLATVVGRAVARQVLEPLHRTTLRLEGVARGELPAQPNVGGVVEIARIEEIVLAVVKAAWERERRYSTAVGTLAHDVRLSLAAVQAAMASARSETVVGGVTLEQDVADAVAAEIDRVQVMTSDLVVLMRPRLRVLDDAVAIGRLASEVALAVETASGRHVEVHITKDFERAQPRIIVDRLLRNLVENAAKAARSRVTISVFEGLVTISDDGPGLPQHVFGDAPPTADASGPAHGYGFEIACRLAESCGGRVVVERAASTGSTVLVYI